MDHEDAEKLVESFLRASTLCDESLKVVKANDGLGQVKVFGRLAGALLGHTYTNVLAPLWKKVPDLQPAAMKEPWTRARDHPDFRLLSTGIADVFGAGICRVATG